MARSTVVCGAIVVGRVLDGTAKRALWSSPIAQTLRLKAGKQPSTQRPRLNLLAAPAQALLPSMSILMTGFTPFGEHKVNPSWEVVRALQGDSLGGLKVTSKLIPVVYEEVGGVSFGLGESMRFPGEPSLTRRRFTKASALIPEILKECQDLRYAWIRNEIC